MGTRRFRVPRESSADDAQPASFSDLQRRCAIVASQQTPRSGCRLPYDPAPGLSAGSCVQPPLALVRETLWESRLLSLRRVVSQRQPLGESSPIQKKTTSAPPLLRASKCHPWTSSPFRSLKRRLFVILSAALGDGLHTFVDRPWRIGNEGQGAAAPPQKSRAAGCGLSLPSARRAPLTAHAKHPTLDDANTLMSIRGGPSATLRRG